MAAELKKETHLNGDKMEEKLFHDMTVQTVREIDRRDVSAYSGMCTLRTSYRDNNKPFIINKTSKTYPMVTKVTTRLF